MAGYIKLYRGWRDNNILSGEFSRADAWVWLIEEAAWKPTKARIKGATVELDRGELTFSVRFMAEKWGWTKSRVDRFIADLRSEGMIATRSKIGTSAGHKAGQGQSIITICNYAKYQDRSEGERDNDDVNCGTSAGQARDKEGRREEDKKEENNDYRFSGRVIKLTAGDFDRWGSSFPALDLPALLQSRDDWLAEEAPPEQRKKWFTSTSNWLASKQQLMAAAAKEGAGAKPDVFWG